MSFLESQSLSIDSNIRQLLLQSGISDSQIEEIIKNQSGNIDSLDQISNIERENIIDKEKMKKEIELEIKESIALDPIINEIDPKNKIQQKQQEQEQENLIDEKIEKDTTRLTKIINEIEIQTIEEKLSLEKTKKQYFGYNIFDGNPEIFQNSIFESLDPEYLIGPSDEIVIMLWGETEFNKEYIVSRDGYLFITNVGQVYVNALTLAKLEKKLFSLLKKVYSSLDPINGNPTTFFDVSLGKMALKPLRVFVLGDVDQPGAYNVKSSSTLFTSLYYFGGPSISGSLRDVRLIRNNKDIGNIDFYDYLLTGKQVDDIRMQRNDVIFIPQRGKTVRVEGTINRTDKFYELKEKEGLKKLIQIAGGIEVETYMERVQISRIIPPEKRKDININRRLVDVSLKKIISDSDEFELYDGDLIKFFKINTNKIEQVTINGAVNRPGSYDIGKGIKLLDLIYRADSLIDDPYMERAEIVRINSDGSKSQIDVNLNFVFDRNPDHNILLKSNDIVTIFSFSDFRYKSDVSISGHVINPGLKTYLKGMQVNDLIFMGGGFENGTHLKNTYFERADLLIKNEAGIVTQIIPFRLDSVLAGKGIAKMDLDMGSEIRIYSLEEIFGLPKNTVIISGHVKRPGTYPVAEKSKMQDLLFRAGGFDDNKHLESTFFGRADLIRTNKDKLNKTIIPFNLADVLDTTNLINPELKGGDEIRIYTNRIFSREGKVKIFGEINQPGDYELKENMTLKDLILEAGGITNDNYFCKIEIARIEKRNDDEETFSKIITLEITNEESSFLDNLKNGNIKNSSDPNNIKLMDYDIITIRPDPYFLEQRLVSIDGYVYYPGQYVLSGPNDKVTDIIDRAGGLRPEAYAAASQLIRDTTRIRVSFEKIIKNPRSKLNFRLVEGDSIVIGYKTNLVTIMGEVNNPGSYKFFAGNNIIDYIRLAGGFTKDASRYATYVKYPDGTSSKIGLLKFAPKIIDGSIIVAGRKEEVEPLNITEYVTNLTKIYSDLTQAYLMIILATR